MDVDQFKTYFYSAKGVYNVDSGGGKMLEYGYDKVDEALWLDKDTGFKAQLYTDKNGNYILAFAGTEDLQDAYQDGASFGWGQWDENRTPVFNYLESLNIDSDESNDIKSIHFVGHSLGGALAQYAAYDFVETEYIKGP